MMKQKTDNKNKVAHMDFETAFTRLEKILETMNEGTTALEPSLALYDEANTLIQHCQNKLDSAESKVETLIKNRQGELLIDETKGKPQTEPFPSASDALNTETLR